MCTLSKLLPSATTRPQKDDRIKSKFGCAENAGHKNDGPNHSA